MNKKHLYRFLLLPILFLSFVMQGFGQSDMKGSVREVESQHPILGVYVLNVNTQKGVLTDSSGNFELEVYPDDLVEIKKTSYKTIKIRIPKGVIPNFYMLDMDFEYSEEDVDSLLYYAERKPDFFSDNAKRKEMYKAYLNHYRKEDLNPLANPFDFFSKRNKEIWAFQKAFDYWENEKFIDFVFNDKLILEVTDLNESALLEFKRQYRPNYEMIKAFRSDYEYYLYIKRASYEFLSNARRQFRR